MRIFETIKQLNWRILAVIGLLAVISLVNLSSTSLHSVRSAHTEQMVIFVVGFLGLFVTALVDYRTLQRWVIPFYCMVVIALVLVLFIGKEINGARRWLSIGGVGFQPSEFAKLAIIMALASWFQRVPRPSGYTFKDLIPMGLMVGVPMFLVLREPDLGHTLMIGFIGLTMAFFERFERRTLLILIVIGLMAIPIGWYGLRDYQKDRILTLIDGRVDKLGAGWHALQAKIAVGSGGVVGKGHGNGTQVAGGFLPENHTDFVFAHWAEEHGFLGASCVLFLYLVLILLCLRCSARAKDRFGSAAAVGVAGLFFFHAVMNIGMVLNVLPVTGVTLPLMSYGGTSAVTILIATGLVLNIDLRRTVFSRGIEERGVKPWRTI